MTSLLRWVVLWCRRLLACVDGLTFREFDVTSIARNQGNTLSAKICVFAAIGFLSCVPVLAFSASALSPSRNTRFTPSQCMQRPQSMASYNRYRDANSPDRLARPSAPAPQCLDVLAGAGESPRCLVFSCVCAGMVPVAPAVGAVLAYLRLAHCWHAVWLW